MTSGIAHFPAGAAKKASEALLRDGVVGLDALWTADFIDGLSAALRKAIPGAFDRNAPLPEDLLVVGTNRINGLVPIAGPLSGCLDLLLHPAMLALLDEALGENWVYESFGVISSFPDATIQKLHADGSHLFANTAFAGALPPYALTIAIPLVDVDQRNGATEFLPGTHRLAQSPPSSEGTVWCTLLRGDCMIWDYMVRHRGQPNTSDQPRPMLYVTACRDFWQDSMNFLPGARRLVLDQAAQARIADDRRRHFCRAKPMPGVRSALKTVNRLVRWYAPTLHRAMRRLARRPETAL